MSFQAEGAPFTTNLIAIDCSFAEAIYVIFIALDTSNERRYINKILSSFNRFPPCR
jgi:hypothetical protein